MLRGLQEEKVAKLIGVDVYIITKKGIPQFMEFGPFKHEFISNRGTKVWSG